MIQEIDAIWIDAESRRSNVLNILENAREALFIWFDAESRCSKQKECIKLYLQLPGTKDHDSFRFRRV